MSRFVENRPNDLHGLSKVVAEYYVRTALGRDLKGQYVRAWPNRKLRSVEFSDGTKVLVSFAKMPHFIIARRIGTNAPRREYSYRCTKKGHVVIEARMPRASHTPVQFGQIDFRDPFPNLRRLRPAEHKAAMGALLDYRNVEFFKPYWIRLWEAASNASLTVDGDCNLALVAKKVSFGKLLIDEAAKATFDKVLGDAVEFILGKRIAQTLGLLGVVMQVAQLFDCDRRQRLVSEQYGKNDKWRKEAFDAKLWLVAGVMAGQLARKRPGTNPVEWQLWLVTQYRRFEKIFSRYQNFVEMEKGLSPGYTPPRREFRPARD